jgi:RecB family exonuclease
MRISASRVNALLQCGEAFRMKYIEGLPEQRSGAAALFGSVMHEALEHWCVNRSSDLVTHVQSAWLSCTEGDAARGYLGAYQALSRQAMKVADEIAADRPEIKNVRLTKDWKESDVVKKINRLGAQWQGRLERDSKWRFKSWGELPALYDESLKLADTYQARWRHLPNALYAELGFDVKFDDWILTGYIDAIEPIVDAAGELVAICIWDYKSYAQEPALAKDWRQTVMYDVAVRELLEREVLTFPDVPIYVGLDYIRLTSKLVDDEPFESRRMWAVTPMDYERLRRDLRHYSAIVSQGLFLPAEKGRKADFCPYPEACCLTHMPAQPIDTTILDARRAA